MDIPFRTEVKLSRSNFKISYQTPTAFIGSCFSDHIGGLLSQLKFPVLLNPFGTLYNPSTIARSLQLSLNNVEIKEEDLILHNNLWHSFSFHGSFSNIDANVVIENTNQAIQKTRTFLENAGFLILTFGTAWVYQHKQSEQIVSNCHKIPGTEFIRSRLSIRDIVEEWDTTLRLLKEFNPNLKIIFTVSPVRHFKDGAHENQLSKATLFLAIDEFRKDQTSNQYGYFPSFEIVHDELRDYRFYADDMVHVSDLAVQYIFEKFKTTYFSGSTKNCLDEIQLLLQATKHRILSNNTIEIKKFADSTLKKIDLLKEKYPNVNFQLEKNYFKNILKNI